MSCFWAVTESSRWFSTSHGDQARVVTRQALFEAERFGIHRAELRVIAAAALGDVMEQRGEVGDLRAWAAAA